MRILIPAFAVIALLPSVVSAPRVFAEGSDLLDQTVVVGAVSATVTVKPYPFIANDFLIEANFNSPTYPVGCLSDYDFSYQLRATDGRVIPINAKALKHPAQEAKFVSNPNGLKDCTKYTSEGVWRIMSVFSKLFPDVPAGSYTLRISFSPHGTGQSADFTPVLISIVPSPKPT